MKARYFDIHAHLNFPDYDVDRGEVIARTRDAGVLVNNVGTDIQTSEEVLKLAEENETFYATIGVHPTEWTQEFDQERFRSLAQHPKVIAVGECGLDYFRLSDENEKVEQKKMFEQHLQFAQECGKPVMLHIRDAYEDVLTLLHAYPQVRAHAHFFAADWAMAKRFLDRGLTISFTGVITFTQQYDEVIKNVPLESLMAETDSPFVAPVPYRGKRAEPIHVREVVARIAELRGLSSEKLCQALLDNAYRVFAIPA